MKTFRTLKTDEIDVRVAQINAKGCSLLLYKNARVDMDLLDETVGPLNWKRQHSRDNANCTVSIYDPDKGEWISKEDTGTESNTEAEKGLASDSFKRACVNWGIGRELYSAPFIWIKAGMVEIEDSYGGKKKTNDKFSVTQIEYDQNRKISKLVIYNEKKRLTVFEWASGKPPVFAEEAKIDIGGTPATPASPMQKPEKAAPAKVITMSTGAENICEFCKKPIEGYEADGQLVPADRVARVTLTRSGHKLCKACYESWKKVQENNA